MLASSSVIASPLKSFTETVRPWMAAPILPVAIMEGGYMAKVWSRARTGIQRAKRSSR